MKAKAYRNWKTEDLENRLRELEQKRAEIKQETVEIVTIIEQRQLAEEARRKLAAMNDAERAALIQAINSEGIASEESVSQT